MPAQTKSLQLKIIKQYLEDSRETLYRSHPVVQEWLETTNLTVETLRKTADNTPQYQTTANNVEVSVSKAIANTKDADLLHTITMEEHEAIIYKLREVAQLNPGTLEKNDLLYLEQQLSDIFGFEVTSELEGNTLPFTLGTMAAVPHQKRHPKDTLSEHVQYPEAGLAKSRGSFGWMLEGGELTGTAVQRERFGVTIPLAYHPEWQEKHDKLKSWYQYRKVLVINPFDLKSIVANVTDVGMVSTLQYQFAGAPAVIRSGYIWSPNARGRVLVFYINDQKDAIDLGPITIE